jgi:radical SAM protein with 4Fe4S-binding SPASM domain
MKVIEGIRTILNARKEAGSRHPQVILQCLYLKSNEHQHDAMKVMGRDLGVDRIEFKKAQFYDFDRGHPLMPERNAHRRYARLPGTPVQYRIKNPRFNSCFRMWSSCVVTWDGKVLPCCFDKDGTWVMGDLSKESFNEIWHGKKYDEFRRGIIKNRKGIAMCNNCTSVI